MSNVRTVSVPVIAFAALTMALAVQILVFGSQASAVGVAESPQLATQLGVSSAAAAKLMSYFNSWYFTILLAALTGGWGAGLVRIAVWMASRYGKAYAIAW